MSATKKPILSSTHAVFKGLQDDILTFITGLPKTATLQLHTALLDSHCKLSDYFHMFDKSPYYIWAIMLDPRIRYHGLLFDHRDECNLLQLIEDCSGAHYATKVVSSSPPTVNNTPTTPGSPEKINFMARYSPCQPAESRDKLNEFIYLMPEDFKKCDPVKWWGAKKAQFPNLSQLARDILDQLLL
ncbi:hypothetical protein M422DRAFT_262618 [Sphaerobolus stellatus SS14]|uniref:HAT C-terminal dimerisation domain-containing protein n=1 Tax=Sphaerobolus stellatus (strain SS14) TaxID=990650 RepID=A0A0C9UK31_SPHS4|nr:hypothetical protein M422DRAFT_262618 [Sphaerobolus stellatus SS14]